MDFLQQIIAFFMAILSFFTGLLGVEADKSKINLNKFNLVWSDEFDGNELDRTKWQTQDSTTLRRGGYWNGAMAEVKDGNLIIYSRYLEQGVAEGDPAGWYTAEIDTDGLFEQTYGYFEVRCILPKGLGQWSAFWMLNNEAFSNPSPNGADGAEIDIFEAPYYGTVTPNKIAGAIHWGGHGDGHQVVGVFPAAQPKDPYNTYNTYGLEWNENQYIYYINGKAIHTVDKSKVAPSQQPEYMILSVEFAGADGIPQKGWPAGTMEDNGRDFVSEFKIDYVRAYQYK